MGEYSGETARMIGVRGTGVEIIIEKHQKM